MSSSHQHAILMMYMQARSIEALLTASSAASDANACPLNQETTAQGRCQGIHEYAGCQVHGGLVNYMTFHFCTIEEQLGTSMGAVVGVIFLSLWLIFLMSLLASTAELYLVPPLTSLSDYLNLSPVGSSSSDCYHCMHGRSCSLPPSPVL